MKTDCQAAQRYWEDKEAADAAMPRPQLLKAAEDFIAAHNTCALATGCGGFVRCTPIEYTYRDGRFWLLSEGGLKFRALAQNPAVCLAIFDPYGGFGTLGGMQVSGRARLVDPWSPDYCALLAFKKIPEAALRGLDHPMYLIEVTPGRIDLLNSAFKAQGFAPRQHLTF